VVFTIWTGWGHGFLRNGQRYGASLPSATFSPQGSAPATPPRRRITIRL
jgi:hypothetical protein